MKLPFLITGLGNPGRRYEHTWHNLGFMVIEILSQRHGIKVKKIRFQGRVGEGRILERPVLLLKPGTFMNRSGQSVRAAVDYYRLPLERLLVIVDDVELPLGSLRLRGQGSAGSHRGLESISQHLGNQAFPRLRIGMGPRPEGDLADIVLREIAVAQRQAAFNALTLAADCVERFILDGLEAAQQEFNR